MIVPVQTVLTVLTCNSTSMLHCLHMDTGFLCKFSAIGSLSLSLGQRGEHGPPGAVDQDDDQQPWKKVKRRKRRWVCSVVAVTLN